MKSCPVGDLGGKSLIRAALNASGWDRVGVGGSAVAALTLLSPSLAPAGSSVMSCVSCFFLSFGNSESAMIALLCLFGGVSIASWNALDVLTVELYPSDKR